MTTTEGVDKEAARGGAGQSGPVGLGGWLILALLLIALVTMNAIVALIDFVRQWDSIGPLLASEEPQLFWVRVLTAMSIAGRVVVAGLGIVLAQSVWGRPRWFPRLVLWFWGCVAVTASIRLGLLAAQSELMGGAPVGWDAAKHSFRELLDAVLCSAYFERSRRVRNTFIR